MALSLHKGSEKLIDHTNTILLENYDFYSERSFIFANYFRNIVVKKKFKRELLIGILKVTELYLDQVFEDKDAIFYLLKALYVMEDNLKPDYDEERRMLEKMIARKREIIEKNKLDELKDIREMEKLEEEIKATL